MKKPLTTKQQLVYGFIREYIERKGKSPTRGEIRSFIGAKSINSISQYLEALESSGYISRRKHDKRNIDLVEVMNNNNTKSQFIQVPVVASVGCDDLSVFAEEQADEFLQVESSLIKNSNMVAIRAIGNSMNNSGIENGDYVLVEKDTEIKNGDKVVAIIDGMATLKRFEKKEKFAILWPESKDEKYKPIIVDQNFKLAGKVISVIPRQFYNDVQIIPI